MLSSRLIQVRFANGGVGRTPSSELSFVYNQSNLESENISQLLDKFYDLLPEKLKKGNLSVEEVSFFNYLKEEVLSSLMKLVYNSILAHASELDSKTPRRDMF